jgi:hypothetical protein
MKTVNLSLVAWVAFVTLGALAAPPPPVPPAPKAPTMRAAPSSASTDSATTGAVDKDGRRAVSGRRTMAPDGEVRISNVAGKVEVVAWDRSEVEVSGSVGEKVERLEFGGGDNYTTIRVVLPSRMRSCDDDCDGEIKVSVPRVARVDADTVSADVTVSEAAGPVRVNTVSGEVGLRTRSRDIEASSVSGDVEVVGNGADGRIEARSVSGDVRIQGVSAELQVESVSGNVDVQRSKLTRLSMKSTSGDVAYGGSITGTGSFEFQTVSGDVKIALEGPRDATYDISTFSGDIDNSFGPKARRTSEYAPGYELRFTEGKGAARIRINSLSGEVDLTGR